jgi:excisionase family DNA binding protein
VTTPEASGPPPDALWTVQDVANYLRVSPSWVYAEAAARRLPCRKFRGHLRFIPSEIREYLENSKPREGHVVALPRNEP